MRSRPSRVGTLQGRDRFDANGDLEDKTISVFQVKARTVQILSAPGRRCSQYSIYIGAVPALGLILASV